MVPYVFLTGTGPYGSPGPVGEFEPSAFVSGRFRYDPSQPPRGTLANGATRYDATFLASSGSVQGAFFEDPRGYTAVGNSLSALGGYDFLMLSADPSPGIGTHDINGFSIGEWTLVNVRLFWIGSMPGAGDFLDSDAMPEVLPTFAGRLALDFVKTDAPSSPFISVFFDGMTVQAVPEPASTALIGAGLLAMLLLELPGRARGRQD